MSLLVLLLFFVPNVAALSVYAACQTTIGKSLTWPTFGCPLGTVYVSATDKRAKFKAVQDAVLSLPQDDSPQWILVGAGTYKEAVNVTRVGPTTILGQTNLAANWKHNLVTIYNTTYINQTTQNASILDNADSQVLTVAPNKYSVWTGAGYYGNVPQPIPDEYGCRDFRSYNINWENRAANRSVGPALTVGVGYANASFYGCSFKSWQDTVFIGKNASVVFKKSEILGQTDYVYGFGTAYFLESVLGQRKSGCLTAMKGNPLYKNTFGAYFDKCKVVRSYDSVDLSKGTHCLGRPWNNASTTVYMDTYMDDSVLPAGFTQWGATDPRLANLTYYAEAGSYGPGWNESARADFEHILPLKEARERFSLEKVMGGRPKWVDYLY